MLAFRPILASSSRAGAASTIPRRAPPSVLLPSQRHLAYSNATSLILPRTCTTLLSNNNNSIFYYNKRPNMMTHGMRGSRLHPGGSPSTFLHLMVAPHQLGATTQFSSFFGGSGGPRRPPPGNRLAQGAGLIGAATVLLGKSKYIFAGLKLTKFASLGSMILSIGTYSMFFGLPYAAGIVGLIFVHETGHALVMMHRNIPFSPMVFMPFMGAVIAMKKHPRDAWEEAIVALGGPVLGSVGAGAVAVAAQASDSQLLFALADFGFMVNLFNLLPIGSMDGGRIAGALSPYAGVAGLGLGGLLAYNGAIGNPIFYLILLGGGYETFQRFYNPQSVPPNYYKITPVQRTVLTGSYFGLVAALIAAMGANQRYRKSPEVLIRERELEKSWDMR